MEFSVAVAEVSHRLNHRAWRACVTGLLAAGIAAGTQAQTVKDPLTNAQVEQVRDTGAEPSARIKLYMKFIDERTAGIHKLASDPRERAATLPYHNMQMHNLLEEFTRLADELQDNLETYSEQHSDMRKTLKELVERSTKWDASLQEPKASPDYDFSRKTALDTAQSTLELAKKVLDAQEQYFATHKAQKKAASE